MGGGNSPFLLSFIFLMQNKHKILIIDDDIVSRKILSNTLSSVDYQVETAVDGENGLEKALEFHPDLILLDVHMPLKDGYETCQEIKSHPLLKDVPVLFLSANREVGDKVKGFQVGALDYIEKPFQNDELLARVKTHIDLHCARKELQQRKEESETLIHILSHDLINPITAAKGWVDMGKTMKQLQNPEADEVLTQIKSALDQQEVLLNHVREVYALDSGKIEIPLVPVPLKEILNLVQFTFKKRLEEKKIKFDVVFSNDSNLNILAEPVSLTHNVLNNLVSNAIKFSYPDSLITLKIYPPQNGMVKIVIEDNGIGMPLSLQEQLFRTDTKTSRPGTLNETGTGFGMPLVKRYLEYYGGNIKVESTPEKNGSSQSHGTKITLELIHAVE